MRGYSLEAQRENLVAYAKENEIAICGYYVDEGYSARKKYTTRKEFMRLLSDVEKKKIDVILFIKMDRWFRSVSDYYTVQKILDTHGVDWIATMENYDTTTAGGRLNLNIRLSIAQNESDMTSERIKFVFDSKVSRGEVITGSTPVGFKIVDKHLVAGEDADIARDVFDHFEVHRNKYALQRYIAEKYKKHLPRDIILRILTNTLYKGSYHGNPNFCDPIIDPARFDLIQEYAKGKSVRKSPTNRTYIFSGILYCSDCGYCMIGTTSIYRKTHETGLYRCNQYPLKKCTHKSHIKETFIEEYLLANVKPLFEEYIEGRTLAKKEIKKQQNQRPIIQAKMAKIKDLYVNDLLTLEDYKKDYELFQKQISELPALPPNDDERLEGIHQFLSGDFKNTYSSMGKEERRCFWRGIIKKLVITSNNGLIIFFD